MTEMCVFILINHTVKKRRFNTSSLCLCEQAVAPSLQAGAARRGPGAGQGEDAGGQEVQHPQVGAGGLPPRHAAPQQGAGRPQQWNQWQWLNTREPHVLIPAGVVEYVSLPRARPDITTPNK